MRPGPNTRRTRGRNNNPGRRSNLPNRNQTFDSNGPEVRIRGNAYQVHEKYLALARDASAAGDRVMSENYLQHAEHYYRIINAINEAYAQAQQQYDNPRDNYRGNGQNGQRDGHYDGGAREYDTRPPSGRESDFGSEFGEDPRGFDDHGPGEPEEIGGDGADNGEALPPRRDGRDNRDGRDGRDGGFDARGDGSRPDAPPAGANGSGHDPARTRQRRRPGRPRPPVANANGVDAPAEPTE